MALQAADTHQHVTQLGEMDDEAEVAAKLIVGPYLRPEGPGKHSPGFTLGNPVVTALP
jgi:hypothetical protein